MTLGESAETRDHDEDNRPEGAKPGTLYLLDQSDGTEMTVASDADPVFSAIRKDAAVRYARMIEEELELVETGDYEGDADLKYGQSEVEVGDLLDRLVEILDPLPYQTVPGFKGIYRAYAASNRWVAAAMFLEKLSRPNLGANLYPRFDDELVLKQAIFLRRELSRGEFLLLESILVGALDEVIQLRHDRGVIEQVASVLMREHQSGDSVQLAANLRWSREQAEQRACELKGMQRRQRRALWRCRAPWKLWGNPDDRLAASVERVRAILFSRMYHEVEPVSS